MNDMEKMLESLSKAGINYGNKLDINSENVYSENDVKVRKYRAERYKKTKFGFVPVLLFSMVIISGMCIYAVNIRDITPLVNSSSDEMSDMSDTTEVTEATEETDIEKSVFPEIETPKAMTFKIAKQSNDTPYILDDPEKCAYIMGLISENCIEKTDNFLISHGDKMVTPDSVRETFPYDFEIKDGTRLCPAQIEFTLPDNDTRINVMSAHFTDYYADYIMMIRGGEISYYRLKNCIYYEMRDITDDIVKSESDKTKMKIHSSLSDDKGNSFVLSEPILNDISSNILDYTVSVDLSETEYRNIPEGFYTISDSSFNVFDEKKNTIEIPSFNFETIEISPFNFKTSVEETDGRKFLNIGVIAETHEYDLTGCTLTGSFDGIVKTDSIGGATHEEYSYPLKFEFEYCFE